MTILFLSFFRPVSTYAQNLEWSTYMGPGGIANVVVTDDSGNVYCAGVSYAEDLATPGAVQSTLGQYLLKFNKDGKRVWGTYYGYAGGSHAIGLDKDGNIIVTGYQKHQYHMEGKIFTTPGAFQEKFMGAPNGFESDDVFIAKYNPAGKLLWATLYGGIKSDIASSLATDHEGNIYVAGHTYNDTGLSTQSAHQRSYSGNVGGFIVKFTSDGKREWASYYGGKTPNWITGIAVDASGKVYISGAITKDPKDNNLYVTAGSHLSTYPERGENVGYVAKFDEQGKRIWGTYYGGGIAEEVQSIAIDKDYNIFISGTVGAGGGVATAGTYQPEIGGWHDVYLAKFDSSGKRQWGTYIGGESAEGLANIVLDKKGDVYLSFSTMSKDKIVDKDAYQDTLRGDYDAAVFKFSSDGKKQWSTYFGSVNRDEPYGIAVDTINNIYITGITYSKDYIATKGSFKDSLEGDRSGFIAKFNAPIIKDTTKDSTNISVKESFNKQQLRIFPNPTQGKFRISGLGQGTNYISIYSVLGTCIYQSKVNDSNMTIDLSGNAKGMYIYQLKDVQGTIKTGKVILE